MCANTYRNHNVAIESMPMPLEQLNAQDAFALPSRQQQFPALAFEQLPTNMQGAEEVCIDFDGPMCDMTVPARKCPTCAANGTTTWVMPGKECPRCNSVVD